ncbi:MAG: type I-E CRISPR-associated protein Cas6/Cse3/CasE [Desulfovibrionaceae bacterium]
MSKVRLRTTEVLDALSHMGRNDEYGMHQAVWSLFSDTEERARDFVYRRLDDQGPFAFLTVSERVPEDPHGWWDIDTKPYAPALAAGDRLAFSLLANPVRTGRNKEGKHARFDVVMEAKLHDRTLPPDQRRPQAVLEQEAGVAWLASRADTLGLDVDKATLRVGGYRVHEFFKRGGGRAKPIRFATLEFSGVGTVTSIAALHLALRNGVGPAKGFGCGLLLVRRA